MILPQTCDRRPSSSFGGLRAVAEAVMPCRAEQACGAFDVHLKDFSGSQDHPKPFRRATLIYATLQ